jgi:hypothetical protein
VHVFIHVEPAGPRGGRCSVSVTRWCSASLPLRARLLMFTIFPRSREAHRGASIRERVIEMRRHGASIRQIAKQLGVGGY